MSGRGDNNKSGSSGRGASNQSNQGFGQSAKVKKSSHGERTGGMPSIPEKKTTDESIERNPEIKKKK